MIQRSCPICARDAEQGQKKFTSKGFEIIQCSNCEQVFTHIKEPVSTEELYEDNRYKVVDNRGSLFDKVLELEYNKVLGRIKKLVNKPISLLDFGCGKGKFLSLASNRGWVVKGVETSRSRAGFASESYGLDVDTNNYAGGKIEKAPFSVISLFHVVEHLQNPKETVMSLVQENLSDGGVLIIEVPNFDSWQSRWAGNEWLQLDVPRHISHFTRSSVLAFIQSLQLIPVKVNTFSMHVGLLGMLNTCLGFLGYKEDLIFNLKNKRSSKLYFLVLITLPVAFTLEMLSSFFGKGGIVRVYAKRNTR